MSTGALTAPFAFLGPAWDPRPTALYTGINAMSDTAPLWRLISRYLNQEMLRAIAGEYAKGRLLLLRKWHFIAVATRSHRKGTADRMGVVDPRTPVGTSSAVARARLSTAATVEARFA